MNLYPRRLVLSKCFRSSSMASSHVIIVPWKHNIIWCFKNENLLLKQLVFVKVN
jgi:hypothetical protein